MSKKDNLKFKKRIKAQILQELAQTQTSVDTAINQTPEKSTPKIEKTTSPSVALVTKSENSDLVKTDLKKSAFIIGSIIISILAIYFIDQKTGFLLKTSGHLFNFLRINV